MFLPNSYRIFDIMDIHYPTESIMFIITVKISDNHNIFIGIQNVRITVDIISVFLLSMYLIKIFLMKHYYLFNKYSRIFTTLKILGS